MIFIINTIYLLTIASDPWPVLVQSTDISSNGGNFIVTIIFRWSRSADSN